MSLLRTKSIVVGSVIAYAGGAPEETQTFVFGPAEFSLHEGDVVKVVEIVRVDETPFARVTVAVLKGRCCGRVGVIAMDMSLRSQRGWRALTQTGSMESARKASRGTYSVIKGEAKDGG